MNIKWIGKEAFLSTLASFPVGASIAREWDSITTNQKFKSIEANIEKLFKLFNDNSKLPFRDTVLEVVSLIGRNDLIPERTFIKFKECMVIMQKLNYESKLGCANDPFLDIDQCADALKKVSDSADTTNELRLVTYELEKEGLIYKHEDISSPIGFHQISPKPFFFCKTDRLFQIWDPTQDADKIIRYLIDKKQEDIGLRQLDQILKWGSRRMNPAIAYLYLTNMVDDSQELGDGIITGYVLSWIRLTEEAYLKSLTDRKNNQ